MKTKLTVKVWLIRRGKWEKDGEITWDGKRLTANSDTLEMRNIMTTPLWLRGGREVKPDDEPELFIRSLWQQYRSYVTVTKAT